MSGVIYSVIQLERKRQIQQNDQWEIVWLTTQIHVLQQCLNSLVQDFQEEGKGAFTSEIKAINAWLQQEFLDLDFWLKLHPLLQSAHIMFLRETLHEGKDHLATAVGIKERHRTRQTREFIQRWAKICNDCTALAELGQRWRLSQWQAIKNALSESFDAIERGDIETSMMLYNQKENLEELTQIVSSLQQQYEQRRMVLEALRSVCKDMGWDEEGKATLANPDVPASVIRLKVQTGSAGLITFVLSLEGIEIHSSISKEAQQCPTQFKEISEKLKTLGVFTQFRSLE